MQSIFTMADSNSWYDIVIGSGAVSLLIFNLPHHPHRTWILGRFLANGIVMLPLTISRCHRLRVFVGPFPRDAFDACRTFPHQASALAGQHEASARRSTRAVNAGSFGNLDSQWRNLC
jgi:hypothetical protein